MDINSIYLKSDGYVKCRSAFFTSRDLLSPSNEYSFSVGINYLYGPIDSGMWGLSYLMSMFSCFPDDFTLFDETEIKLNGSVISLTELSEYTCYLDRSYPLFSSSSSVDKLIKKGLQKSSLSMTSDEIIAMFDLDLQRVKRPLSAVGNEVWRAMAAIGYSHGKKIFCFPWLTQRMFEYYKGHFSFLFDIFENQGLMAIIPLDD